METTINELFKSYQETKIQNLTVSGWIRNNRAQKEHGFIDLHDGTCFASVQVVYEEDTTTNFKEIQKYRVGSSITVKGSLVLTPLMKQPFEIKAQTITLIGNCPEYYPIQPKRHTREYLRENAHLRMRTNLFQAVFRVRSVVSHAIHTFFQDRGFIYVHTPIITGSDAEGAGEMFKVTTLDFDKLIGKGPVDYENDFFGKATNLTVSGQLQAEAYASAFRKVYTFGPTFRAENSNTQRHASEFWMIEPEIAFCDLKKNMEIAEEMVKFLIKETMSKCSEEIAFFEAFIERGLIEKLTKVMQSKFASVTHRDAIKILKESKENLPMNQATAMT